MSSTTASNIRFHSPSISISTYKFQMKRERDDGLTPYATALLAHKNLLKRFKQLFDAYRSMKFYAEQTEPPPGYNEAFPAIRESMWAVQDKMTLFRHQLFVDLVAPDYTPQEVEATLNNLEKRLKRYQFWLRERLEEDRIRRFEEDRRRYEEAQVEYEEREARILEQENADEWDQRDAYQQRVLNQRAREMNLRRHDNGVSDDDSYEDDDPKRYDKYHRFMAQVEDF